jgi:putative hydrolase of the HAD superfamily
MIEAIIFDLGNVIVSLDFAPTLNKWARLCGREAEDARAAIWASGAARRYETGALDDAGFYREISSLLGLRLPYEEFMADWNNIFGPPLMDDLIIRLARKYPLWALSDTCPSHIAHLWPAYGPLRHFRGGVFSYEVGAMKPDAAMFRAATERAGFAPENCFYTDDRQPNVEAAATHGLHAVLFTSQTQLEQDLRAAGVAWE